MHTYRLHVFSLSICERYMSVGGFCRGGDCAFDYVSSCSLRLAVERGSGVIFAEAVCPIFHSFQVCVHQKKVESYENYPALLFLFLMLSVCLRCWFSCTTGVTYFEPSHISAAAALPVRSCYRCFFFLFFTRHSLLSSTSVTHAE